MTYRLKTIIKLKILLAILLAFNLGIINESSGRINYSTLLREIKPETEELLPERIESEQDFQSEMKKYIPNFVRNIFNSYQQEKYSYRVILLFFLIIFLFVLNVTFIILIIIYSNKKQNYSERYISVYKNMYENALLTHIMGEADWEQTQKKLKKSNLPQNRELLSSILMNLHENLKGIAEQMIPEIFMKLELHNDALNQSKSKLYYEKVLGIRKLTLLYPEGAMKIIPGLINYPDEIVRSEAQTSYVRLNPDAPFDFLKALNNYFTRWTQITAFYIFRLHRKTTPSFANYLDSENTNVRNFSLRMITFFQQLENIPEVLKMLDSKVESTRYLAVKAVNDLRLYDGKFILKEKFKSESLKNQIEIIKAFKNIGNDEDFDFLEKIIGSNNVSLKLEACRSFYYMGDDGSDKLSQLNKKMNGDLDMYIAHISDSRN